jgi:phage N-6-adenine-methyltransferase
MIKMTDGEIVEFNPRQLSNYDPHKGLKGIAVAEAAERLFARAKDTEQLYEAIKAKLQAQRDFVLWWESQEKVQGARTPRRSSAATPIAGRDGLPDRYVIDRWRKRVGTEDDFSRSLEDARNRCRRILEQEKDGTIRGTEGTGEFERYTPPEYIDAAREILGEFDLDPATCAMAQETVRANEFFTAETDGLSQEWHGKVWMNPPYHRELAPAFISKLIEEKEAGRVSEAVVLTNNSTDTAWFQQLAPVSSAICFTKGRINFTVPNGPPVMPTQGQAFFYLGDNPQAFAERFAEFGLIVKPWAA